MEFFGLNISQIILISLMALLVFGPDKLPEIAGKAGRLVKDVRKLSNQLRTEASQQMPDELTTLRQRLKQLEAQGEPLMGISSKDKLD